MNAATATGGMRVAVTLVGVLALAAWPGAANATFHTFQIDELYSSPDGMVQFVELHEAFAANGQEFLMGRTLTSTQGATTRVYTFPANLPNSLTAGKRVLIATPGFVALGIVTPDYVVPGPFLFPGGGTVNYAAGTDSVTYPALPADGVSSLNRSGTVGVNSPTNYAGQTGSIGGPPAPPVATAAGVPALDSALLAALSLLLLGAAAVLRRRR